MVFVRVEDPWQVPAYVSRGSRGGGWYLPTEWLDTSYVGARDPCAFSWSSSGGRVDTRYVLVCSSLFKLPCRLLSGLLFEG